MDYFTQLPAEQKILLLVIIIIVGGIVSDMPVSINMPYLLAILLSVWVGYVLLSGEEPSSHSCQKMIVVKKDEKEGFEDHEMENFDPRNAQELEPELPMPDYKNMRLHSEEEYAESPEDRKITNYPYQTFEDDDGNIYKELTNGTADYLVTDEKDEEIHKMYFPNLGVESGDTRIAKRMSYMSTMPKRAIENRAQFDKYTVAPYVFEELRDSENTRWWDNQDLEAQF